MKRLLPFALLLLAGCSSGPVIDTKSMIGPLLAAVPWACIITGAACLAVGWWGCWWLVTKNNPGVDLKMPHRAMLRRGKEALTMNAGDGGMGCLGCLGLPIACAWVVIQPWVSAVRVFFGKPPLPPLGPPKRQ